MLHQIPDILENAGSTSIFELCLGHSPVCAFITVKKFGPVDRNTAAQLGSSITTGVLVRSAGRSAVRVRRRTRLANFSRLVEIQVSPQHTVRRGTSTSKPADSSTATPGSTIGGTPAAPREATPACRALRKLP